MLYTILYTPGLLLLVLPAGMLAWFGFLRPIVRRRHYRAIQALTRTWQLQPVAPGVTGHHKRAARRSTAACCGR